jgi:hypothetical protein
LLAKRASSKPREHVASDSHVTARPSPLRRLDELHELGEIQPTHHAEGAGGTGGAP